MAQLAEVLYTTIDFLIAGNRSQEMPIYYTRPIQPLQVIDGFEPDERETVLKVLDVIIAKHNMERTVKTMGA